MDDTSKAKAGMGAFAAGLIGAAMGAAAVYFADRKNREKVQRTVNDLVNFGKEEINCLRGPVKGLEEKGKQKVTQELEKAKEKVGEK